MSLLDKIKKTFKKDENAPEFLKSLCFCVLDKTAKDLLNNLFDSDQNHPVREIEFIIFGMFIVTEAYTSAMHPKSANYTNVENDLNQFHYKMEIHVINEVFLKENTNHTDNELAEFSKQWNDCVKLRYAEYRLLLQEDLSNGSAYLMNTASFIGNNFFLNLSEDDRKHFILLMSIRFVELLSFGIEILKQKYCK